MNLKTIIASLAIASTSSISLAYEWGTENSNLPTPPAGFVWQLNNQFTDEFNSWDASKWQAKHDWWNGSGDNRPGAYVEGNNAWDTPNVQVSDSKLKLYAKANGPSQEKWVGTSVVSSRQKISYGYYEVRMKASKLATTSSFWMQGKYSEIDVIEAIGAPKVGAIDFKTSMHTNYHYFPNGFGKPGYKQNPSVNGGIQNSGAPDGAANGWHTYGVWWKNNKEAYFYLDGKRITDFSNWNANGKTWDKLTFPAEFNEAMVLFFDTEVWNWGGGRPGIPTYAELTASDDSNAMQVDWVRAYKLAPGSNNDSVPAIGTSLTFKANGGQGGYVWANANDGKMHANSSFPGTWGVFIVEKGIKPNTIALKHKVSGKYLRCLCGTNANGTGEIIADASKIDIWESYTWTKVGNNQFTLKAHNGKYVYATLSGSYPLYAYPWSNNGNDNYVKFQFQAQ